MPSPLNRNTPSVHSSPWFSCNRDDWHNMFDSECSLHRHTVYSTHRTAAPSNAKRKKIFRVLMSLVRKNDESRIVKVVVCLRPRRMEEPTTITTLTVAAAEQQQHTKKAILVHSSACHCGTAYIIVHSLLITLSLISGVSTLKSRRNQNTGWKLQLQVRVPQHLLQQRASKTPMQRERQRAPPSVVALQLR